MSWHGSCVFYTLVLLSIGTHVCLHRTTLTKAKPKYMLQLCILGFGVQWALYCLKHWFHMILRYVPFARCMWLKGHRLTWSISWNWNNIFFISCINLVEVFYFLCHVYWAPIIEFFELLVSYGWLKIFK
jgi:hypothetical protein